MTVRELARSNVVTATPATSVADLAASMRRHNIGSVVVEDDGAPVGIVTDRDIGVGIWDNEDPTATTAADLMTEDPVTVDADTGVYEALQRATEANVRRLPVVDDDELAGIVTLDDFVVLLAGELDGVAEIVQAESPSY